MENQIIDLAITFIVLFIVGGISYCFVLLLVGINKIVSKFFGVDFIDTFMQRI